MKLIKALFVIVGIVSVFPSLVHADARKGTGKSNSTLIALGAGIFDVVKDPTHALVQVEYRTVFKNWQLARPIAGLFVTNQGGVYVYGGLALDIYLGSRFVLMPGFAPGLYFRGHGKKLWFPLEFRSSIELAYVFQNKSRFGAQFYHISNASLGNKNPGVEALVFNYSFAL